MMNLVVFEERADAYRKALESKFPRWQFMRP